MTTENQPQILVGIPAIAEYLGLSRRKIYHLVSQGALPVFKLGGKYHARPEVLDAHIAELERKALGDAA